MQVFSDINYFFFSRHLLPCHVVENNRGFYYIFLLMRRAKTLHVADTMLLSLVSLLGAILVCWSIRVVHMARWRTAPSIEPGVSAMVFVHEYWQAPKYLDRGLSPIENQGFVDVQLRRGSRGVLLEANNQSLLQGAEFTFKVATNPSNKRPLELVGQSNGYRITRELLAIDTATGLDRTPELCRSIQSISGRPSMPDVHPVLSTVVLGARQVKR